MGEFPRGPITDSNGYPVRVFQDYIEAIERATDLAIGAAIAAADAETTPNNADILAICDSTAAFILKKITWANTKATLKTYFDTLYLGAAGEALTAAKWATARTLAGNSVDGSANVPFTNKVIVQGTVDAGLTGAQFLGALATGILKNTTTTGVLSIAEAADFPTLDQNTTGTASNLSGTPALPDGTTATTQAPGDNSTKLATTAYADAVAAGHDAVTLSAAAGTNLLSLTTQEIGLDTQTANYGFFGPVSGAAAAPTFRAAVAGDLPSNSDTSAGIVASGAGQDSKVWKTDAAGVPGWRVDATGATPAFSDITAGTNATALVIGTDGSLGVSGTGTITATALGAAYIDWDAVSGGASILNKPTMTDYVPKSLFDAYSVLMATSDDTPAALIVTEETVVGRVTGGAIAALALGVAPGNVFKAPADFAAHGLLGFDNTTNTYKNFTIGTGLSYDQPTNTISSSGSGAPTDAHYLTDQAEAGLSAEVVVTADGKSLVTAANYAAMKTLLAYTLTDLLVSPIGELTGLKSDQSALTGTLTTASTLGWADANLFKIAGDDANAEATGNALNGWTFYHRMGGSALKGARQSALFVGQWDAASNAANGNRNYVPLVSRMEVLAGDGGTAPTAVGSKGNFFGFNPVAEAGADATNLTSITAMEADTVLSGSAYAKMGVTATAYGHVQGSVLDCAFEVHSAAGSTGGVTWPGWKNAFMLTNMGGRTPLSSDGCILLTDGAATIAKGIDWSSYTFTGSQITGTGWNVAYNGGLSAASVQSDTVLYLPYPYTVATLPAASTAHKIAVVSDALYDYPPLTGGGSIKMLVYSNGSSWVPAVAPSTLARGPASATNGNIPKFNGTDGKLLADSGYSETQFKGATTAAAQSRSLDTEYTNSTGKTLFVTLTVTSATVGAIGNFYVGQSSATLSMGPLHIPAANVYVTGTFPVPIGWKWKMGSGSGFSIANLVESY